jgi:hypothetical protein
MQTTIVAALVGEDEVQEWRRCSRLSRLSSNPCHRLIVILLKRADHLSSTGSADEARADLERARELARERGFQELEETAVALLTGVEHSPATPGALACVHCGRTTDPSLREPNNQLEVRAAGRRFLFAQCADCREALAKIMQQGSSQEVGYFALRRLIGEYPIEQKRGSS